MYKKICNWIIKKFIENPDFPLGLADGLYFFRLEKNQSFKDTPERLFVVDYMIFLGYYLRIYTTYSMQNGYVSCKHINNKLYERLTSKYDLYWKVNNDAVLVGILYSKLTGDILGEVFDVYRLYEANNIDMNTLGKVWRDCVHVGYAYSKKYNCWIGFDERGHVFKKFPIGYIVKSFDLETTSRYDMLQLNGMPIRDMRLQPGFQVIDLNTSRKAAKAYAASFIYI